MIEHAHRQIIVDEAIRHLQAFYLHFKAKIPKPVRVGMEDLSPDSIKALIHLVSYENEELPIIHRRVYTSSIPFIKHLYYAEDTSLSDIMVLCFTDDFFIFDELVNPDNTFFEADNRVYIGLRGAMVVLYNRNYTGTTVLKIHDEYKEDYVYGEFMVSTEPEPVIEQEDASTRAFNHKRLLYTAIATLVSFSIVGGVVFLIL